MLKNQEIPAIEEGKILTRDEVLQETSSLIEHLKNKAKNGRFRDINNEKMRDSKLRALTALLALHSSVLKDSDLDEMKERITALEENRGRK